MTFRSNCGDCPSTGVMEIAQKSWGYGCLSVGVYGVCDTMALGQKSNGRMLFSQYIMVKSIGLKVCQYYYSQWRGLELSYGKGW